MAQVHDENHAKKKKKSDDFGSRNPVIQKTFEMKSAASIVARVDYSSDIFFVAL